MCARTYLQTCLHTSMCWFWPHAVDKAGGFFSNIKDKKDNKDFLRKRKDDGSDYSLFR